jgi:tRNA nucleotidyltransferase/poly(A) polymerase
MNAAQILELVARLNRSDRPIYLVGGAVRDQVLGREPHDLDFAAAGNIRALAAGLADTLNAGFYPLDEERGTYRVVLENGRMVIDFAMLRGKDILADLCARDFTLNAMARDIAHPQELIDPLGGLNDLTEKQLRSCTPTSLYDDPARTLRAVRLAVGLDLEISPQTSTWIQASGPLLARISSERIRDELIRMLESPHPAVSLRLLDSLGLASLVLPELEGLKGLVQPSPHVNLAWEHTLEVLERLETLWNILVGPVAEFSSNSASPPLDTVWQLLSPYRNALGEFYAERIVPGRSLRGLLFLAALYHDVAKPLTRSVGPDGKIHFLGHDDKGAQLAANRARMLALSGEEAARIQAIIAGHMRVHYLSQEGQKPSARAIYRYFRDTGPAGIDICLLSLADTWATYSDTLPLKHWQIEVTACQVLMEARWERTEQVISPPRLLDGNDLMRSLDIRPGPAIGRLLEALREAQAEGEIATREEAMEFIRRIARDLV